MDVMRLSPHSPYSILLINTPPCPPLQSLVCSYVVSSRIFCALPLGHPGLFVPVNLRNRSQLSRISFIKSIRTFSTLPLVSAWLLRVVDRTPGRIRGYVVIFSLIVSGNMLAICRAASSCTRRGGFGHCTPARWWFWRGLLFRL